MKLPLPDKTSQWFIWAVPFVRELQRAIPQLESGSATLGTGTTTTVSVTGLTKFQRVYLSPTTAGAWDAKPVVTNVADGQFTVTHLSGVSGRSLDYLAY